ncbi:cilia- and flagella-associated protein 107-like [Anticarsia gemmatalis]|uniref:cilia- and flagella-associated protein 107-like n=1 Tax=Anticarsia gemmatalis TaxID=129554 RepID=UPI003F770C7D
MAVSARPKSPSRVEAMSKALVCKPLYSNRVLLGNWVEERIECPRAGTFYFPPKEVIDYEKLKPESRQPDFRINKLNSTQGNIQSVIRHDSHDACANYATTNDLVYNHMPKPLCGPVQRYYKKAQHQWYPQPDLMKCFGNATEWGLRRNLQHEWKCTDVSDYQSTLYDDTYVPPHPCQYLQPNERKARNSSFTKSFRFKMTKSKR